MSCQSIKILLGLKFPTEIFKLFEDVITFTAKFFFSTSIFNLIFVHCKQRSTNKAEKTDHNIRLVIHGPRYIKGFKDVAGISH